MVSFAPLSTFCPIDVYFSALCPLDVRFLDFWALEKLKKFKKQTTGGHTSLFSIICPLFYKYSLHGAYVLILSIFLKPFVYTSPPTKNIVHYFSIFILSMIRPFFCPLLVHILLSILLFSCIVLYFLFIEWSTFLFFVLLFSLLLLHACSSQGARKQGPKVTWANSKLKFFKEEN